MIGIITDVDAKTLQLINNTLPHSYHYRTCSNLNGQM